MAFTRISPAPALAATAAAGALLTGCSGYKAPELSIGEVALTDQSPHGMVLELTFDARNDNEVPLPLREISYQLDLGPIEPGGWTGRFHGNRSPEATLRAGGVQRIVLPAAVPLQPGQTAPTGPVPYRFRADLTYITPGALAEQLFDTGVRRPNVTFNKDGIIEFGQAPAPGAPPAADAPPPAAPPGPG